MILFNPRKAEPCVWSWVLLLLIIVALVSVRATDSSSAGPSLPYCSPTNLPLSSVHLNLMKYLQGDGSFVLAYPHCRMRNFEGHHFNDVQRAMQGNHLVFMGDSLSRYSYTSFAHFLSHRRWVPSFVSDAPEHVSVCSEFDFHSWAQYYPWTNQQFNRHNQKVTEAEIRRHPHVSYEICDCRRPDGPDYAERTVENRHFRLVPVLPLTNLHTEGVNNASETLYQLHGDLDDTEHDIRLSFLLWFGAFKIHTHKLLMNIPRNRVGFENYVKQINQRYCTLDESSTFYPLTDKCELKRVANDKSPTELSDAQTPFPPSRLVDCPVQREQAMNMHPPCHAFQDMLTSLNATHLVMNSAHWHNLARFPPNFLSNTVQAARLFLTPVSISEPAEHSNYWQLRPIVWRRTFTATVPLPNFDERVNQLEKQTAMDYLQQQEATGHNDFDVFPSNELTQWMGTLFRFRSTKGESSQAEWKDIIFSVDYLRRKNLLAFVKAHPTAAQYHVESWKEDNVGQLSSEERFLDKYRGIPAQSELGREIIDHHMNFTEDIKPVYIDRVHFSPYVYNEINKVFLSATVPVR